MAQSSDKSKTTAETWADIKPHANSIANRMFVFTADRNYILARIAFFDELDLDFFWLSLHAIEKYFKAILLMNGGCATGFNHNLVRLYDSVLQLDSRIDFGQFTDPKIGDLFWHDESVKKYLERLNKYGAAANRYLTFGYNLHDDDLLKVDQLIWRARRYCRALVYQLKNMSGHSVKIDKIELLQSDSHRWKIGGFSPIEELLNLPSTNPRRQAFVRFNVPFAPNTAHALNSWHSSASNPPLADWFRLLRSEGATPETRETAAKVIRWAINCIEFKISKRDRVELEQELDTYICNRK